MTPCVRLHHPRARNRRRDLYCCHRPHGQMGLGRTRQALTSTALRNNRNYPTCAMAEWPPKTPTCRELLRECAVSHAWYSQCSSACQQAWRCGTLAGIPTGPTEAHPLRHHLRHHSPRRPRRRCLRLLLRPRRRLRLRVHRRHLRHHHTRHHRRCRPACPFPFRLPRHRSNRGTFTQ